MSRPGRPTHGRSPEEWRALVEKQVQERIPVREFCAAAGFSTTALSYWKRKFASAAKQDGVVTALEKLNHSIETIALQLELIRVGPDDAAEGEAK
jgi:hypothetical protein